MKVTKINVYRLEVERDCGCKATREYEDPRYQKPMSEGSTTLCEKHSNKSEDAQEILREMILDTLTMQAEQAGKTYVSPNFRAVEDGEGGGIVATGESQEVITGINLPKRPTTNGPRRDPMSITQVQVDRPQRSVMKTAAGMDTGVLNLAGSEAEVVMDASGVEISTEIGVEVPEDPNLSAYLESSLGGLGDMLDQDDAKLQGVPQRYLNEGE